MSDEGIESILSDEAPATETSAPVTETPSTEAEPAMGDRPRDDKGRFASQSPTGGEVDPAAAASEAAAAPAPEPIADAPPTPAEAPMIPRSALLDERQKRQAAEARFREMEAELARLRQPQPTVQPEAEEEVDFYDDPDKFLDRRLEQFGSRLLQQIEQRQVAQRADRSEAAARAKYEDYDSAFVEFQRAARADPTLISQLHQADDPGEFVYRKGKQTMEISQIGDLDTFKAQLRAEWEAELRAKAPSPSSLPPSTAGERSLGVSRTGPEWSGPESLSDLLGES